MIPKPAQYLLRFDGFCPTMPRIKWERFSPLIAEFGIRPILAIVPDNQDVELMIAKPDLEFWDRMRSLEAAGATIAMEGYQHLCASRGKSLIDVCRETEFAGVNEHKQREWIRGGLTILREQGLSPRLFVAPRHGFDGNTLRALAMCGLGFLSDGLARIPYMRGEVTLIPQQLWEPVERSKGLWTICVDSNSAPDGTAEKLRSFLERNSSQFTTFDRVLSEYQPTKLGWAERIYESAVTLQMRMTGSKKYCRQS